MIWTFIYLIFLEKPVCFASFVPWYPSIPFPFRCSSWKESECPATTGFAVASSHVSVVFGPTLNTLIPAVVPNQYLVEGVINYFVKYCPDKIKNVCCFWLFALQKLSSYQSFALYLNAFLQFILLVWQSRAAVSAGSGVQYAQRNRRPT
jgi:hypothetical protein